MFIPHSVDVSQRATRNTSCQTAAFPNDAGAETDRTTEQTESQHPSHRSVPVSRETAQKAEARSNSGGLQGVSNRLLDERSKRSAVEKSFSTGTSSLQPR